MKKHFLFSLSAALTLAAAFPLHAQSAGYTAEEKNRINQEIDSRLGWVGSNWEIAKNSKSLKLPNYFAAESSRFFQPGPPAYAQQPEYAEIAGLASIIATELNSVAASEIGTVSVAELQTAIVDQVVRSGGSLSQTLNLKSSDGGIFLNIPEFISSGAAVSFVDHFSLGITNAGAGSLTSSEAFFGSGYQINSTLPQITGQTLFPAPPPAGGAPAP